jgi:hypothetical protein
LGGSAHKLQPGLVPGEVIRLTSHEQLEWAGFFRDVVGIFQLQVERRLTESTKKITKLIALEQPHPIHFT